MASYFKSGLQYGAVGAGAVLAGGSGLMLTNAILQSQYERLYPEETAFRREQERLQAQHLRDVELVREYQTTRKYVYDDEDDHLQAQDAKLLNKIQRETIPETPIITVVTRPEPTIDTGTIVTGITVLVVGGIILSMSSK